MSDLNFLTILSLAVGIIGGTAGVVSLLVQFVRDRARLQLAILRSIFGNEPGVGFLEVRFEVNNVGNYPTSITELTAWIMDGTSTLTAELDKLRPNKTDTAIRTGYPPDHPPPLTVPLPQRIGAHSSEIYTAIFRAEAVIQTGRETACGMTVRHTHDQVTIEGVAHPQPIQRAIGAQNN
jgi:hypothetical protein